MRHYVLAALLITVAFLLTLVAEQLAHYGLFPLGEHAWYLMIPLIPGILYLSLLRMRKRVYGGYLPFLKAVRDGGLIVMIASLFLAMAHGVYVATVERERSIATTETTLENEARAGTSEGQLKLQRRVLEVGGNPLVQAVLVLFMMLTYGAMSTVYVSLFVQIGNKSPSQVQHPEVAP